MSWLQTISGKKVSFIEPNIDDIDIEDIAWGLSRECRFNGHTKGKWGYSVAQHSVLVSRNCENKLWGLLHDAPEAYLRDIPRPLKQFFKDKGITFYEELENKFLVLVAMKFDLSWPIPPDIKIADDLLLVTESRDLKSPLHPDWIYQEANGYPTLISKIEPWEPEWARSQFLLEFDFLTKFKRQL